MAALRLLAVAAALCAAVASVAAAPATASSFSMVINGGQQQQQSSNAGLRLIELGENDRRWMTDAEVEELAAAFSAQGWARGFMDITEHPDFGTAAVAPSASLLETSLPTRTSKQAIVLPLLARTSSATLRETTTFLSSFKNRYYTSATGVQAANDLLAIFQEMISFHGRAADVSVRLFKHSFVQPSVIATIKGSDPSVGSEIIALGAHLDSYSSGTAPGADDDASGVANILEIFRVFLDAGYKPKRTIEFMAFAAEEAGLKGSIDIANQYAKESKEILTMYNCEMSGYTTKVGNLRTVTVLRDYVDTAATDFLLNVVDTYCNLSYKEEKCGYACSDQASFQKVGYKTVCAAEAGPKGELNPYYHTAKDTVDKLDFEYSLEFTKMALAFAVELSEL